MQFEPITESKYFKTGKVFGFYLGFFVMLSVIYFVFFRSSFNYLIVIPTALVVGTIPNIIKRLVKYGKTKITF